MSNLKVKIPAILIITIFLTSYFPNFIIFAQANNLSDYQYQVDQYRSNYAEFQILKNDYQTNPTLNNEQKAILAAKQTIAARELAMAYYALILIDKLKSTGVVYPIVDAAITDLGVIGQFHFKQSQDVAKVITKSDLAQFTATHLTTLASQADKLGHAQVAIKIAELIQIQNDAKLAYDSILPGLKTKTAHVNVKNGLDQIVSYSQQINDQISALSQKTTETGLSEINLNQYFEGVSLSLNQIRALQSRLINIIIELDTVYVDR